MKKIVCVLLLFCTVCTSKLFAQASTKITVKGVVVSFETNQPMQGASVVVKGESRGQTTDSLGNFSVMVEKGKPIEISFIGYENQELVFSKSQNIIVQLKSSSAATTDEVVVIGYGTQKKSSVTGAVAKYKNDKIDETSIARLDQALQGRIAGVQVQNINSEAGAEPKISIRGISSINAGASPLVVVDGQPIPDGLAFVNMADVESVEVLKDAASAAIYGSRGASGVILVTTKSGKADKTKYSFKYSLGFKNPYKLFSIMTVSEYTKLLFDEASLRYADSAAYTLGFSAAQRTAFGINKGNLITPAERGAYVLENTITGATDWQNEALRTGINKNIQLSASGGTKDLKYFMSGGYQRDEGMMYHSNYEKFNIRTKFDAQLSKRVKLSININPSYSKRERPSVNFTDFYRFLSYLPVYHNENTAAFVNTVPQWANIKPGDFTQARHFNARVYSGLMPDGSNWVNTIAADPFATNNNQPKSILETRSINTNEYRLQGSADLTINILPGLDFKTLASSYINYTTTLDFAKRNSTGDGVLNRGIYNNRTYIDLLSENTFTYNKKIKNHSINILAGFTAQKTTVKDEQTTGLDYPSDNITTLNTALQVDKANTFNLKNQIGLLSYLGRVNYSYANKYLLSASFRADGSSYFAEGNKWGTFPSISAGWVAKQEKFLSNVTWLNNLKLRASYGVSGNNRITDFAFVDLLYAANYPFNVGNGTPSSGQAASSSVLGNPDITWESTFQSNFGLDIVVLKNRISLSVDMYISKTDKLLQQQSAMAFTGVPLYWNNIGSLRNRGVEFELSTININKRNFKWTTTGNLSHNRNEIIELGKEAFLLNQGERTEVYMNKVGSPLVQFFGFKTDGVWLSQAEIDAARAKGLTSGVGTALFTPGGIKLVDVNGDNTIDNNDRTVIGTPYPDFTWGLTNNFTYKSFDFSFTFQGVQGGSLIDGDANYNESKRYNKVYTENRWLSPNNPGDGRTPYSTVGFNIMLTDYVVEDASYYALREVLLGYKLPNSVAKAIGLSSIRLYASGQNLFFHNAPNYRSLNPEARSTTGPYATSLIDGYQRGAFPTAKSYLFGIDINF